MIERLSAEFRVATRRAPSPSGLERLRSRWALSAEWTELYGEAGELEFLGPEARYFRLWAPEGVLEMDAAYRISEGIPGAIPVGDDGGGNVILVLPSGIFRAEFGALHPTQLTFVAHDLGGLLEQPRRLFRRA